MFSDSVTLTFSASKTLGGKEAGEALAESGISSFFFKSVFTSSLVFISADFSGSGFTGSGFFGCGGNFLNSLSSEN